MSNKADVMKERLDRFFRQFTRKQLIEQAVIAVESGDRSFRWVGTHGETSAGNRVFEDTPFFIASIDKLYNATIVLQLSETHRLDIDEPITSYLPDSVTRGLHRYRGIDHSEKITVRHLLTHTSGLADWLEDYPKSGQSLIERVLKEGDQKFSVEEMMAHVRDHLTPHFPPQNLSGVPPKARYSDTNFMLIIAIIEVVTGQPLHEVHKQMLYEPIGLKQTFFPGFCQPAVPTTNPMTLRARGKPLSIPLLIKSVRGIYSTVGDMMAFLRMFMRGELFQNRETLTSMQSSWYRFGFPLDRAALRSPGWPIEYGLGVMRFRLPRLFTPTASLPPVLGHTGSTGCWLLYCPNWDILLAGSVEEVTAGSVPFRVVPKVLSIIRALEWRADE